MDTDEPPPEEAMKEPGPDIGFIEVAGSFGFNIGEQTYVPNEVPGNSQHPITNGFGANVTAGWEFLTGLSLILDYSYSQADSRSGELNQILTRAEGEIDYHTLTLGLRTSRWLGIGRLYGELAVGVVFPFETKLEIEYAPEMSALGLMGTGRRVDEYNAGVGVHGELGYQFPVWDMLYLSTALRIQGFQSNNNDQETKITNFVEDFADPQPVTTTIEYDTVGGETPQTYSVQDIRFHINVGYWF